MTSYVLAALSNPATGIDDEKVAAWYDGIHIPQIRVAIPNVGEVRRLRAADAQPTKSGEAAYRYLTTYEIEADSAAAILAALGQGMASGVVESGDVLNPVDTVIGVYQSAHD